MDISSNDSSFFPFFSNQLAGHGWLALLASLSRSSLNRKLAWLARSTRHARVAGRLCLFFSSLFLSLTRLLVFLSITHFARSLGVARFVLGFSRLAGSPACLVWLVLFLASFADSLVRSLGLAGSPASLVWLALFLASLAYSLGWLHLAWLARQLACLACFFLVSLAWPARQLAWYGSLCSWFLWLGWLSWLL